MKVLKFFLILMISSLVISCGNSSDSKLDTGLVNNPKSADGKLKPYEKPRISFSKTEHDFGNVIKGEMVKTSFKFTNIGKADLLISKVATSCGCTVADYTKKPVRPGKSGKVEILFNTKGKTGHQNKTVTVMSNATSSRTTLRVKANIVQPEK